MRAAAINAALMGGGSMSHWGTDPLLGHKIAEKAPAPAAVQHQPNPEYAAFRSAQRKQKASMGTRQWKKAAKAQRASRKAEAAERAARDEFNRVRDARTDPLLENPNA